MSTSQEFRLPDVGEGLTEAEVVAWHVAVGDTVAVNDVIVEIETAKSVVELPSPHEGVIDQILVEVGETAPVGTPLVVIASAATHHGPTAEPQADPATEASSERAADDGAPAVLVGSGPRTAAARRRRLPTRNGEVGTAAPTQPQAVDRSARSETRIAVRGVRKATASAMVRSAFTAPHVTEWLAVDMTASMELVRRVRNDRAWQGVRVSPLLLVARAFLLAVRRCPEVNASWDDERNEIVLKHDVNLGIAAATPRGLLVPNIKRADTKDLRLLAAELESLIAKARAGKTQPADLAGGTVTITNIGALGVDAGTPILNPGESAILAFGAVRPMPWVVDGRVEVREVTQLAMSFDHRLVDGELGSRVLSLTGQLLSDPGNAVLYA